MNQPDSGVALREAEQAAALGEESERSAERELSLTDMLQSLYLYKKWIALFTLLCLLLSTAYAIFSWYGVKDLERHKCVSAFSVQWDQNGIVLNPEDPSQIIDIQSAEHIVDAVIYLLYSDNMATHVREVTSLPITRPMLRRALTASRHEETSMVELSIVWDGSAEQTMTVLNAVLDYLPALINSTMKNGSIQVFDHANAPERIPILPSVKLILLVTLIGLVLGCGGAILLGLFRTTVQSRENITSHLRLETVGEIPRAGGEDVLLHGSDRPLPFKYSEAYRTMLAILRHRMITERLQSVYITSTMAAEGKTTLLINIARSLSEQEGYRVLLVDYDTRKPRVAHLLRLKPMGRTVHGVVNGKIALADAIIKVTDTFHVLCADTSGFCVLNDDAIEQFNALRAEYDFIFYDTPPVGIVSDCIRLNDCTDACLYAIKHNYVTVDIIRRALHILTQSSHPIMGAILNEVKENPLKKYYYESHYRHYGYYSYDKEGEEKTARGRR